MDITWILSYQLFVIFGHDVNHIYVIPFHTIFGNDLNLFHVIIFFHNNLTRADQLFVPYLDLTSVMFGLLTYVRYIIVTSTMFKLLTFAYIDVTSIYLYMIASYLHSVGVVVQQQDSRAGHLLGLHHRLQISEQAHVFGHVRC